MFVMGRTAVADPRLAIGAVKIRSMGFREPAAAGIFDVRRSPRSIAPREVGKRPIPEVCELPE